jgi:hypothetical protein
MFYTYFLAYFDELNVYISPILANKLLKDFFSLVKYILGVVLVCSAPTAFHNVDVDAYAYAWMNLYVAYI